MRAAALGWGGLALACSSAPDPFRYRLSGSGTHWSVSKEDRILDDLRPRYPEYFETLLDPAAHHDLDLRALRDDLEHRPVDRRNYDALNAVAIGYFELNYRAEAVRGEMNYLTESFRVAHLLAIPWRAYSEIDDPALRDAILAFFEDAASGEKLGSSATAPRLKAVVASLEAKEPDAARRERIRALVVRLIELSRPYEEPPAHAPLRDAPSTPFR